MKECCENCKFLKELWWWEGTEKKFGQCCVMLLPEGTVVKIENPKLDMCEVFCKKGGAK